eukprot:CAMPEP_0206254586 /NCGR_PEP_ID=MMETSP0047_2-20121206/23770_1 /ASSEMBLY_ACC=CAM_ASM_000192 /TAXON_ID=195065 /ORGANISM="Chroomonas mesostigmatica_cf, Strain CCMP1168" /LENGTH=41 /DNA_ID= /DNA_START= /DNA_END= /DNA_ORIENTATION=
MTKNKLLLMLSNQGEGKQTNNADHWCTKSGKGRARGGQRSL